MLINLKVPNFDIKNLGNYFDKVKGQLHLPENIVDKMKGLNLHSADDVLNYLKSCPAEAAKIFNTSVENLQEAAKSLNIIDTVSKEAGFGARESKESDSLKDKNFK